MNTQNLAKLNPRSTARLETGTVQGGDESACVVQGSAGIFNATVAFSCLVTPQPGDRVLFCVEERHCHVLHVLERPTGTDMRLRFPGSVECAVPRGEFQVNAGKGFTLNTPMNGSIAAGSFDITASRGQVHAAELKVTNRRADVVTDEVRLVAGSVTTIADRWTQRLKLSFRWIEELEQTSAGQLVQKVRDLFSMQSRQAVLTAKQDVKIDGERIHMG